MLGPEKEMTPTCLEREGAIYGAKPDDNGPLGGGEGCRLTVDDGQFRVNTINGLLEALHQAEPGDTVFLEAGAALDFTERVFIAELVLKIPAGVTLAGDRGRNGSAGALLYSDAFKTQPLIEMTGPKARITGLRLRGPDPKRRLEFHYRVFQDPDRDKSEDDHEVYYRLPNSDGILVSAPSVEVDNCEISGWSHSGVHLRDGKGHHIHHNFIHHCQRMGLGYGICLNQAEALIEFNLFQDNKHHIAGSGMPGSGYEARHNLVLPYTEAHPHPVSAKPYGQDHLFDMHGGRDRADGTDIAGSWLRICNNTFIPGYVAVNIRGTPEQGTQIHHNWFAGHADAERAIVSEGNTEVRDNLYGPG